MDETYYEADGFISPAVIMGYFAVISIIMLISIVAHWRIFQKANRPGWAAIIPIYSFYVTLKIAGKPGWWLLLLLVPLVNFYVAIKTIHLLSKSFGKDVGFTLGLIFLPFIFFPILAFSSAKYEGPYGDRAAFEAYQNKQRFEFEQSSF